MTDTPPEPAAADGEDFLSRARHHAERAFEMPTPEQITAHQNHALIFATMAVAEATRDIAESLRGTVSQLENIEQRIRG